MTDLLDKGCDSLKRKRKTWEEPESKVWPRRECWERVRNRTVVLELKRTVGEQFTGQAKGPAGRMVAW